MHFGYVLNTNPCLLSALAAGPLALKLSVDAETVIFAIHDILTQGIVGYWLLLANDNASAM